MRFLTPEAQKVAPLITTTDVEKRRVIYQAVAEACTDIYMATRPDATLEQFTVDSKDMVYDIAEIAIVDRNMLQAAFRATYFYRTRKAKTAEECRDSAYFNYPSFENFLGVTEAYAPELITAINANFELFTQVYRAILHDSHRFISVELVDIDSL